MMKVFVILNLIIISDCIQLCILLYIDNKHCVLFITFKLREEMTELRGSLRSPIESGNETETGNGTEAGIGKGTETETEIGMRAGTETGESRGEMTSHRTARTKEVMLTSVSKLFSHRRFLF